MDYPKVSIIILNWNGVEDTIECLESLKKITYPNYEVILVDNGSEGNDVEVLTERFGDYIHLIENDKNYGFTGGNNIGIRYALGNSSPDYFLLLNSDTVVAREFLTEMVKVAEDNPRSGIAGSKTYFYNDPNRFWVLWDNVDMRWGKVSHVGAREIDQGQYDDIREVDHVPGSCFLVKRKVIQSVGLLDESYFSYWEDLDYCIRARKAGYKIVYVPKAKIWHRVSKKSAFHWYYRGRNYFRFIKKHATWREYWGFLLYFFGYYFWRDTAICLIYYRGDVKSLLGFYKGVRDGLFMNS